MMKMRLLFLVVVAISTTRAFAQCACCAGAGVGSSNGAYNNGILTLPKKTWLAEIYSDNRTFQSGIHHHPQDADTTEDGEAILKSMLIGSVGLRYGLTKSLTLSALLPQVFLHTRSGNDKGLGDLIFMGTWNVYSRKNQNLAIQFGVELPTGVQKNSNFDNTTVIVGSGSYDPLLGISFSKKWNKLMVQGNGLYKYTTNGFQGNYYGSLSIQNFALSYQIYGGNNFCSIDTSVVPAREKLGLSVFGGYYGEWLDKLKEDGVVDDNSGHYLGFATLGANFSYSKWALPLTISLPVINRMNGDQNHAGYRWRVGIIRLF